MKLVISRTALEDGLQIVNRALSRQTSLPVLQNVLIEPGTDGVTLLATDPELAIECRVPARLAEGEPLTLPARLLQEIVAALSEEEISLEAGDSGQVLLRGGAEFRLAGLSPEQFPRLPEVGEEVSFQLSQSLMREIIRQTAPAASTEENRPSLTGVCLQVEGEQLRLIATDDYRLSMRTAPVEVRAAEPSSAAAAGPPAPAIVPLRAMRELARVLEADSDRPLHVCLDRNGVSFRTDRVNLVSRLIQGRFPSYQRLLPTNIAHRWTIPRARLQAALRRARLLARDTASHGVILSSVGEMLVVSAEASAIGAMREEFAITREGVGEPPGGQIQIALNVDYLLDAVGAMDAEQITLEIPEPLRLILLRPVGRDDTLMLIAPKQVS